MFKAIFLDFYGTVVHEDDVYIEDICKRLLSSSSVSANPKEIGDYWWKSMSSNFKTSHGNHFKLQRELELESLSDTIQYFRSSENPHEISDILYEHWMRPEIFEDSKEFIKRNTIPIYVLSNIDRSDITSAIAYNNLEFNYIITSEDVRSYKPRPEMFERTLKDSGLNPNEVLHVGDSLTSDVSGANSMGIPVAWVNRKGRQIPEFVRPDYVITKLTELLTL
ncbi:HAD family hydrolase [Cohnella sp. 56]|uniref:HAD family hydrolase n=1 Tax=Cohnella sp. 56 TaxID=3113722 RepID=UPI0030EAA5E4